MPRSFFGGRRPTPLGNESAADARGRANADETIKARSALSD